MNDLQSGLDFPLSIGRKILSSTPAPSTSWSSTSHINEATLDPDPVVILFVVAVVCLFMLVIGLNSLLRWLLRCSWQMVLDSSDGMANNGLKKAAMKALPIRVYTATSKPRPVLTDCPICLAEFGEGEKMRVLPKCNHGFHVECIDKWLVLHSSCPMCRYCLNLNSQNKKPEGAAIAQAADHSNNSVHIVIQSPTDSTQAVRMLFPHEAAVTAPSRLPGPSLVYENESRVIHKEVI